MDEVIIRSNAGKLARIINTAIAAKAINNPDHFANYQCTVYYKMMADLTAYGNYNTDSIRRRQDSLRNGRTAKGHPKNTSVTDTTTPFGFTVPTHVFMTESFSRRQYKRPGQTQEVILASKFSGLRKTYFANVITDVLPFHIYTDYIPLNGIDFINPIAKGWQSRYRFLLENEVVTGADTLFIFSYSPKEINRFNALEGLVYISSRGYAITHFTGATAADSTANRFVKFSQVYEQTNGRWFPKELTYRFSISKVPAPYLQMEWSGYSIIDSALFDAPPVYRFNKARPVRIADSVDLHTGDEWNRFRHDTLTEREANTYKNYDTLMKKVPLEKFIYYSARLATGRLPAGKADIDIQRLFASNAYEGTRLGAGLYTNNNVSKYYSVGGWYGYGFKDKASKYGGSVTLFPKGDKDAWLSFSYQHTYRLTGQVALHPELYRQALQNFLLQQVDVVTEYAVTGNIKPGYWEIRPSVMQQQVGPLLYGFHPGGKEVTGFTTTEASLRIRYAYAEKRTPFFEYYLPSGTRYPVVYAALGTGHISATGYKATYYKALLAVTFSKHINRWGNDRLRLEGGLVQASSQAALPRSVLLAATGYRRNGLNLYASGGLITLRPFGFYSNRYVSFLYKHDLDKNLWRLRWSQPFISIAHNLIYGGLNAASRLANDALAVNNSGYHESGVILNHILKYSHGLAAFSINTGVFYHWQRSEGWTGNHVFVLGLSAGF